MPVWAQGNEMTLDDTIRGFEAAAHQPFVGVPDDWSSHRVVFSRPEPGSETEYRVQQDPRYWLQQIKEKLPAAAATSDLGLLSDFVSPIKKRGNRTVKSKLNKDWSEDMGAGAKVGGGQYPAKFGFFTNIGPNCTTDYVAFNTGLAGGTSTAATGTGTFANNTSVAGNTVVINGVTLTATGVGTDLFTAEPASAATTVIDGVTYTWTATTCNAFTPTATTGCVVQSATIATDATNLMEAITTTCGAVTNCKVFGANPGATAAISSSSTATVVVTNTTAGAITWSESSNQTLSPATSISAASTSGLNFALSSNTTTAASNLATAINNNTGTDDVIATSTGAVVTLTAVLVGTAGNSIGTTETLAGFSWGGTTLAGGANGQASIFAFNELYKTTCSNVPSVYWAYNTGSGSTVATAPALSFDGSQIAFIQSSAAGVASLVLVKWRANTTGRIVTGSLATSSPEVTLTSGTFTQADVGVRISGTDIPAGDTITSVLSGTTANLAAAPSAAHAAEPLEITADAIDAPGVPPTAASASAYRSCTAPCMYAIPFGNAHNDTNSFPFYDYSGSDLLFAGDDTGDLHKFEGVFNGTPSEVTTGGWPATVSTASLPLSTSVYDPNSQLAFVGEGHVAGATDDGHFHSVSSTGTVTTSGPAGDALCHGVGYTEGPILDPSATVSGATIAGTLYIGCDHDVGTDTCGTSGNNACLRQFAESGISGGIGTSEALGAQADAEMYAGAFDHIYLSASGPTGNLYFCGNPAGGVTLYRVPISNNVMGTPVTIHALSTTTSAAGVECSPITEFYNSSGTPTDWLFMSEPNTPAMNTGTCTGTGCVYSYNATTAIAAGTTATAALPSANGSSGIVVDDNSSTTGASQVYFSTLGNETCATSGGTGGCAIQAAQNGLSD